MKLKRVGFMFTDKGMVSDEPSTLIVEQTVPALAGMHLRRKIYMTADGYGKYGDGEDSLPLDGGVTNIYEFKKLDGTSYLTAMCEDKVYKYVAASHVWSNITASDFTGDIDDRHEVAVMNDTFVSTNNKDAPRKWDGEGNMSALSIESFTVARIIRAFNDHLCVYNVIEGSRVPMRCRWTDVGTIETWSGGTSGAADMMDGRGVIMNVLARENAMMVYKEYSIVAQTYVGGGSIFEFNVVVNDTGLKAQAAVCAIGNDHLLLGHEDIYAYIGGRSVKSVGADIRDELFRTINEKYGYRSIAFVNRKHSEATFVIPTTSDYPDTAWTLNYINGDWTRRTLADVTAIGYFRKAAEDVVTIGDLVGTIGQQSWRFGDTSLREAYPFTLLGNKNGNTYEIDPNVHNASGSIISSYIETKDFSCPQVSVDQRVRWMEFNMEARGSSLSVEYSVDGGYSWTGLKAFTLNGEYAKYSYYTNTTSRIIRYRVSCSTLNNWFHLRWLGVGFIPRGESDDEIQGDR